MAVGRRGRPSALACALGVLVLAAVAAPGSGRRVEAQTRPEAGFQVQADGLAAIEQGNVAAARERAITDALQRAVEQATETLLPAETLAQQDPLLRSRVYADTASYVQTYRIVTETPAETLYQVSVEAVVAREPLRQALVRLGLIAAGGPKAGSLGIVTVTARGAARQLHLTTLMTALVDRAQAQRVRYRSLAPGVVTFEVETPLPPLAVADELARLQVEGAHLTVSSPDGRRLEVTFIPAR
jgi:hypothetical protein